MLKDQNLALLPQTDRSFYLNESYFNFVNPPSLI